MGNESAKKRKKENAELMSKYNMILLGCNVSAHRRGHIATASHASQPGRRVFPRVQAAYFAFRVFYLWASLSGWHMAGLALLLTVQAACWLLLSKSATPVYAPLEKGGALISGGEDLDQKGGVLEYTWDMLYVTLFVLLTTGFISDWFWLLYTARHLARQPTRCASRHCSSFTPNRPPRRRSRRALVCTTCGSRSSTRGSPSPTRSRASSRWSNRPRSSMARGGDPGSRPCLVEVWSSRF